MIQPDLSRPNLKCLIHTKFNFFSGCLDKESSKVLSFERDKECLCVPIGCKSGLKFVLANRNTEKPLDPLKPQHLTALFDEMQINNYFG